ncbi:MAG: hypothetical protein Ct9H90mP18_02160 [Gammaproteobacteria bacterium]|nr:MAG: hypothetical protein Ct9H90mP18_02160 [Gammaproteobacteria bacterium]
MYGLVSDNIGILSSDMENSIRDYIVFDLDLVPTKDEINNYLNEVDDLNREQKNYYRSLKSDQKFIQDTPNNKIIYKI